jgi:predicted PurR-regulated permease PerM
MPNQSEPPRPLELLIPWRTLLKVAIALLLAFILIELRALAAMLFAAALIATTLEPVMRWVVRRKWPRWIGVALCALLIFTIVGGFVAVLVPTVSSQGKALIERLPTMREDILKQLPEAGGLRGTADQILAASTLNDPAPLLKSFVTWGARAFEGLMGFIVILVVAIYLVADGEGVYEWLAAFLPKRHRAKADETAREVSQVVRRWITGQAISSTLAAIYAFTVLSILKVPGAALLAVFAGLFDVIPIIGFFCATVPAMASALTVSPTASLIVLAAYAGYHLLETYFIVPKIFGDRLKLSMLAVLIGCLVAGYLAGPLAILFALPIVASYPVIERIWLQPYLATDTVEKHEEAREEE